MTTRPLLGIDLHGTLLDPDETFPMDQLDETCDLLAQLSTRICAVACTGNDLSFVASVLPLPLLRQLEGFVLETGCSYAASVEGPEVVYVPDEICILRDELELRLREQNFSEVTRFGRRLASISLFTSNPRSFADRVAKIIQGWGFADAFSVTYSSVAIDIIPHGYDKLSGLRRAAGSAPLYGIADSVNDLPLLAGADLAFAPANLAEEATKQLIDRGNKIVELTESVPLKAGYVIKASASEVRGVIEILRLLNQRP